MNILVVDDDLLLCTMLSEFLEENGFTVFSAADALQAFDILERQSIGLIITDYEMPHMNGARFVEALKKDARLQAIPVLMITAHAEPGLSEQSLRKGVALMLEKPVDFERLLTLVRFAQ